MINKHEAPTTHLLRYGSSPHSNYHTLNLPLRDITDRHSDQSAPPPMRCSVEAPHITPLPPPHQWDWLLGWFLFRWCSPPGTGAAPTHRSLRAWLLEVEQLWLSEDFHSEDFSSASTSGSGVRALSSGLWWGWRVRR
jgi:hypothetical protein